MKEQLIILGLAMTLALTGCTRETETVTIPTQTPVPTLIPEEEKLECWEVELDEDKIIPLETIEVTKELKAKEGFAYMKGEKGEDEHTGDEIIEVPFRHMNDETIETMIIGNKVDSVVGYYERYETTDYEFQDYHNFIRGCKNLKEFAAEESDYPYGWATYEGILCSIYTDCSIMRYCPPAKSGDVTVPYGITLVDMCTFMDCDKITSIRLMSSIVKIEEAAFGGNTSCTEISVDSENPYFMSKDGVLYTKDCTELIAYPAGKTEEEFRVPDGVKVIRAAAFKGAKNLKKVVLSDEVEIVENEAFRDCSSLVEFEGGKKLRELHAGAFYHCEKLERVNFQLCLRVVREKVFDKTNSLKTISLPQTAEYADEEKDERVQKQKRSVVKTDRKYVDAKGASQGTGTPDTSWYKKGEKKYILSTADELAGFAKLVNEGVTFNRCVISLKNDVDLSKYEEWTPIGGTFVINGKKRKNYFEGSFDGNGHTIYNLTVTKGENYSGLFRKLYVTEEIRNLNIEGAYVIGGEKSAILVGDSRGDITNCSVNGHLWGTLMVGGIVGTTSGLNKIRNCCNKANVVGDQQIGGICGFGDGVSSCKNEGKIEGCYLVGGIIGEKSHGSQEMQNCENVGEVSGFAWVDDLYIDSQQYNYWVDR